VTLQQQKISYFNNPPSSLRNKEKPDIAGLMKTKIDICEALVEARPAVIKNGPICLH